MYSQFIRPDALTARALGRAQKAGTKPTRFSSNLYKDDSNIVISAASEGHINEPVHSLVMVLGG